jgi:hypothetical protein
MNAVVWQDVFDALYQYMEEPPEVIFYDFACSMDEVSLYHTPIQVLFLHATFCAVYAE